MNSLPVQPCVYFGGATFRLADFPAEIAKGIAYYLYPSNVD